jgi:hypothetical protein
MYFFRLDIALIGILSLKHSGSNALKSDAPCLFAFLILLCLGVSPMIQPTLPSDDLPPSQITSFDRILQRQLEESTAELFYESCDRHLQALLSQCDWYITATANAMNLVINCPNMALNWSILHDIIPIGNQLEKLSPQARIRVCPPTGMGGHFDIRVDELDIYRDSL